MSQFQSFHFPTFLSSLSTSLTLLLSHPFSHIIIFFSLPLSLFFYRYCLSFLPCSVVTLSLGFLGGGVSLRFSSNYSNLLFIFFLFLRRFLPHLASFTFFSDPFPFTTANSTVLGILFFFLWVFSSFNEVPYYLRSTPGISVYGWTPNENNLFSYFSTRRKKLLMI